MTTEIKQLTSGFWSVWVNGEWIDAASSTRDQAEKKLEDFLKQMKGRASSRRR